MSAPPSPSPRPTLTFWLIILGLLVLHAGIALEASTHKSTTNDEVAHITGGYTFNQFGDFRIQPENGVLPQRWHGLGLAPLDPAFPNLESVPWTQGLAYQVSYDFFYRSGNDPDALLLAARTMNVGWGLATLGLIALATFRCFGPGPALFATGLAALSPTMLAHSALATSDMAMAFFFVAVVFAFWWHLNNLNLFTFAVSSLTFGLACVAKFSAVMLLPMMAIMIVVRCLAGPPINHPFRGNDTTARRALGLGLSWAGHGLVAVSIIWLFFGFRFAMMSPDVPAGTMPLAWENILSAHPGWEPLIFGLRDLRILPEAFLYGFSYVLAFSLARGAFLDGQVGTAGWVDFFPKTFLYKTPSAELISLAITLIVFIWWLRRHPSLWWSRAFRWIPGITLFGLYWAFSLTSNLNIGHRHILPTYPLLFIATGAIIWASGQIKGSAIVQKWVPPALGATLIAGQLVSVASIHPHHLAYFNTPSGGPTKGYQHLVDSSLDWGQDLPGLAAWLDQNSGSADPVFMAYFGTGEPAHYGINARTVIRLPNFDLPQTWLPLEAGTYAISATMLQHPYRQQHQPWSAESEAAFQNLVNLKSSFWKMAGRPEDHPELLDGASVEEWRHAWNLYNELRFARLCEYLKIRPPEAMIGYSILIFQLDETEIQQALHADLPTLVKLIESATDLTFAPETH